MSVAFVAFVASMPFEAALMLGGEGFFSISRLVGYGLFGVALLKPGLCFRKPPPAFWWFAIYVGLYILLGLYQPEVYQAEIRSTIFRMVQFLTLLLVGYNLLKYEAVARWSLWAFGLACVAVGGLLAVGIGVSDFHGVAGRQTVFGQGPNSLAALIGLGAVTLIGMAYGKAGTGQFTKMAAWGGFLIVAIAIARTGSRGALVGLAAGLMTLIASQGSARTRLRNIMIVVLALGACIWITIMSATTASRWHATLEEGSLAGRQRIFHAAFRMIEERPILGWGPVANYYELGRWLNMPKRDTHNLFLWLLTEQGIVGTIPFCIGLTLCARAAWRARRSLQGFLPFALLVSMLTVNLANTFYATKSFWVTLAYALASEAYLRGRGTRTRPLPLALGTRRGSPVMPLRMARARAT